MKSRKESTMNRLFRPVAILKQVTFLGVLSFLLAAKGMAAPVPQDLYKEAQLQESTSRDLDAAIRLYEEYLSQPSSNRAMRANAYLHLGLCQAKLGKTEPAKISWKTVIADYSGQADPYPQAVNQLQILEATESRSSTPTVKVVYAIPRTRFELQLIRVGYISYRDQLSLN